MLRQNEASLGDGVRQIVTLDHPAAPYLDDFPIKVHALGARQKQTRAWWPRRYGYTPAYVRWLKAHVAEYDAVIVNGLWNYSSFGASRVLPNSGVPYFVFTHGMMDPWFRRTHPFKHAIKQMFWLVGEGRLLANARAVLFTCEEERLLARGEFFGHSYREIVVGYGAADVPPAAAAHADAFDAATPALLGRPFLLFLGRLHDKKGCDLLLSAFAQVAADAPELDLVMAGPDQTGLLPRLKAQAKRLGIEARIHWTGPLYADAKWGAFRAAQAFVLPSHQENFGIAVAEALACETPVLISDKVNIWREIKVAEAGYVEPDTLSGTVSLLRRWLSTGDVRRAAMGQAARGLFEEKFNVNKTGPALLRMIESYL